MERRTVAGALPVLEIRFPVWYAYGLMGFGALVLVLSIWFAFSLMPRALDIFIAVMGVAAIIGGNYWRHHLHVVARLTPRQLILRRGGAIDWSDIAEIDKKVIRVRNGSEFACIKLKTQRPPRDAIHGFVERLRSVITGYDVIVPSTDLSCTVDFFIAECRKRMAT